MFFHVLSFSFIFFVSVGFSKSDFFLGLNFVTISLDNSYVKNQFLGPSRVVPLWALLSFFLLLLFSPVFCLFSCFLYFHFFYIFCSFLHFLNFFCFSFSFFIFPKKKVVLFFFLVFLSNIFSCWRWYQSLTVSSVVGAPWRCGVLTT